MAGVGGGRRWWASRWRASLAGSSSLLRACAFLPYLIDPWTGAVAFSMTVRASSASGGHMHAARATPRCIFLCMAGVGKNSKARDLPSAELGGRQVAGVIWLEARPAWALATRIKNALRSLGTLRRTRGFSRP